jgi:hypothetical protein
MQTVLLLSELGYVDIEKKKFIPVVFLPGFGRELSFKGKYTKT